MRLREENEDVEGDDPHGDVREGPCGIIVMDWDQGGRGDHSREHIDRHWAAVTLTGDDMGDRAPRNDMVRGTLRKASKVVDAPLRRTEEAVRKIAERPNIDLMDAPHLAWEFLQKGRQQAEKARGVIDAQLRKRLKEMGLATREEMDALKRRISELEAAARGAPQGAGPTRGGPQGGGPGPKGATETSASEGGSSAARPARPRPKAATPRPKAITPRPTRARGKPAGTGPTGTTTADEA
jgi:polyhydroxyalkanoate synthesis regulator phasin